MRFDLKKLLPTAFLFAAMLFGTHAIAQTSCCTTGKEAATSSTNCASSSADKATSACAPSSASEATSGCTPSACRGAQTKFGEAKVISDLRTSLIALKADMEKSTSPAFDARSFDIHGIVGETDDESLEIIVREVQLVETAFVEKLNHDPSEFTLPENKAKQVAYLNGRIGELQKLL